SLGPRWCSLSAANPPPAHGPGMLIRRPLPPALARQPSPLRRRILLRRPPMPLPRHGPSAFRSCCLSRTTSVLNRPNQNQTSSRLPFLPPPKLLAGSSTMRPDCWQTLTDRSSLLVVARATPPAPWVTLLIDSVP